MIEFKSLQNRFLIHQALLAASANSVVNTNSLQHDSLEINTSSSSLSSQGPSPIPRSSPNKRKLSETDEMNSLYPSKRNAQLNKQPASSFLISDILGLNANKNQEMVMSDEMKLYQQYQASLQQSYFQALASSEFLRLIANTTKINEFLSGQQKTQPQVSPIPRVESRSEYVSTKNKCANGILSSLEQLTKSQFDDDDGFNISSCLNRVEPSSKRSFPASVHSSNSVKRSRDIDETSKKSIGENVEDSETTNKVTDDKANLFPAWVYCTRYSDRPSAGPRHRRKSKTNVNPNTNHSVSNISNSSKTDVFSSKLAKVNSSAKNNSYSSSSSNSSFSHSPQFHHIQKAKPQKKTTDYDHYPTENDSRIFNEKHESNNELNDNEEELCYDSDDSNMSNSKRPRTAFTSSQLNRLKSEFDKCKYLTGEKRQFLANELKLNESQIKIWFQNKRAKIKKSSGVKNSLAVQLMEQGLYNHGSNAKDES